MARSTRKSLLAVVLAFGCIPIGKAQEPKPPELTPEEQKLAEEAKRYSREAVQLYQRGQATEAIAKAQDSLSIRQKLYPASKYPDGHVDLANSFHNLGVLLKAMGSYPKALPYQEQAVAMRQKLYPVSKYPNGHEDLASSLNSVGSLMRAMGSYPKALNYFEQALSMYQKLYPVSQFPDGHADLASGLNNLGGLLQVMGQSQKALPHFEQALSMRQKLYPLSKYPDGHPELANSLNSTGVAMGALGLSLKALPYLEQAFSMRQKLFPVSKYPYGHEDLTNSLHNLGSQTEAMGAYPKALTYHEQTFAMRQKLYPTSKYPDGHPDLATSLNSLGGVMKALEQYPQALTYLEQALAMKHKLYPKTKYPVGHPDLANNLNSLGRLMQAMGQAAKALAYDEQSLEMYQKLYPASKYPDGHVDLAISINNQGTVLRSLRQYPKALTCYEQSLAIYQRLYPASKYPDGHPNLARSLNSLGGLMHSMELYPKAMIYLEQALAMREKLYPVSKYLEGHPDLANSLNAMGILCKSMNLYPKAMTYCEKALAMRQQLYPVSRYPDGHQNLVRSLGSLGQLLHAMSMYQKALPYFEQALRMDQKLGRRIREISSESEALFFGRAHVLRRDAFLSVTSHVPGTATSAYASVWATKSEMTRVMEQRHAAARVTGTEHARKLDELRAVRKEIDHLLQNRRLSPMDREKFLVKAINDRDVLERELAKAIPFLEQTKSLDLASPEVLTRLLPDHTVLIDFVRYTRFNFDGSKSGKAGETRLPSYAAFVFTKGQPIRRVELGETDPINKSITQWRKEIDAQAESLASKQLRELIWVKLAPHLPAGTKTLYLSPDGDLARMPWAALPISENRVLLEDFAISTVPHGQFVLESLKYPREYLGAESLLLLGGLEYNSKEWPRLLGTKAELIALKALAPSPVKLLDGTDASSKRLIELLPSARYAHLATHGYYDKEALTAEQLRASRAVDAHQFGDDSLKVAGKNPLAFTGLVLSGGEILSGLTLVDLQLENLKLVTLSACETGLGQYTGGEGVQGLQRAFHLAGCPNVVASLWKVGDVSTAVLMEEFYSRLWNKEKPLPPIEALREAQLTILRNPDKVVKRHEAMVAELKKQGLSEKEIASRGFKTDLATLPEGGKVADLKRSPTHWWAGFVLSGGVP